MSKVDPQSHWDQIVADVPADLAGRTVLDIRPAADSVSERIAALGAARVQAWDGKAAFADDAGGFDLVVCREALNRTAYPANFLSAVWGATAVNATLVLHCRVMTPIDVSMYARFVEARTASSEFEWLPGRLAFRWSVETSGFDVDHWIDSPALKAGPGEGDAYLVATRVVRPPSLVTSTPETADR